MDNFDLKRFLVENKITKNSKLHEAPHLDFDPIENPSKIKEPSNTINTEPSPSTSPSPSSSDVFPSGKTNLTVGDIITKDMLRHPDNGNIFDIWNPAKILKVFKFPNSTKGRVVIKFNKDGIDPSYDPTIEPSDYSLMQGHYTRSFPISDINRYTLKPPYRIVLPSSVSTPTSTPKSFSPSEPRQNTFSPLEETLNNFNLKKFLVENKVTRNSNLFEAYDFEFNDTDKDLADKMSNEVELKIGDTITPDMWDKQKFEDVNNEDIFQTYEIVIQDSYLIEDIRYYELYRWYELNDWVLSLKLVNTGVSFTIELNSIITLLKDNYFFITPDMNEAADDFEFTDTDKDLANQLELENNLKKTFLKLWDEQITDEYLPLVNTGDVIYNGLDKVLKDPELKEKTFNEAYNRIVDEDFESEEERYDYFKGSVMDEVDFNIMAEFAPQLARNLLTAGFEYDSDEDLWILPDTNQFSSYGIIWDIWGIDYDTNIRETIGRYLKNAAQALD